MYGDRWSYTCGECSIIYGSTCPITRLDTWKECNICQLHVNKKSLKSLITITITTTKVMTKWIEREREREIEISQPCTETLSHLRKTSSASFQPKATPHTHQRQSACVSVHSPTQYRAGFFSPRLILKLYSGASEGTQMFDSDFTVKEKSMQRSKCYTHWKMLNPRF